MLSSSPAQEEITSFVFSVFAVKDIRQNLDALQFEVEEEGFKEKFIEITRRLESKNFVARLEKFFIASLALAVLSVPHPFSSMH